VFLHCGGGGCAPEAMSIFWFSRLKAAMLCCMACGSAAAPMACMAFDALAIDFATVPVAPAVCGAVDVNHSQLESGHEIAAELALKPTSEALTSFTSRLFDCNQSSI